MTVHPIVARARALDPVVRSYADEGERCRRLPDGLVEALREAELLRMRVGRAYGGPEGDPVPTLPRAH